MAHDNIAEKNEVTNKAGRRQSERHGVRCVFVFSAPAATSVEQHRSFRSPQLHTHMDPEFPHLTLLLAGQN